MKEILLVSNAEILFQLITRHASKHNVTLVRTNDLGKAWNMLNSKHNFSKLVLDIYMPRQDSLEFAQDIKKFFPNLEIIGLTTDPVLKGKNPEPFTEFFLSPYSAEDYTKILS